MTAGQPQFARWGAGWRAFVYSHAAILAVFAVWVLANLLLLPLTGTDPAGPDDYTRLLQVRALLDGQSWWDVTQYRMDPPTGASMHWSRLVDLPLAAVALVAGETAALVLVPLLWLLPALFALRFIMQRLGFGPLAMLFGLVILPLFPLLPGNFAPMRIDHHAPQAVLGLICAACLLAGDRRAAILGGVLAGAWLAISIEGLPIVALIGALYGMRYWQAGERQLPWFLSALAIAAPAFSLATRPVGAFAEGFCDILLPGHMAAFAAAAVCAALIPLLPGRRQAGGRLAALAVIPVVCAPLAFLTLGPCAADPFSTLPPLLKTYWHGQIAEGLPVWRQPLSTAAMLLWTPLLVVSGWWIAAREGSFDRGRALAWAMLALLALGACAYSLLVMRAATLAQLLAIPFAACLLAHFLPMARSLRSAAPRILATVACVLLLTPTFASAVAKPLDRAWEGDSRRARAIDLVEGPGCDFARLAQLPGGLILTSLDAGPEVLGKTGHTILAASYHRNEARMAEVVAAFTGSPEEARRIAAHSGIDYVVTCRAEGDFALYRTAAPGNFANTLAAGEAPGWLEPVPGFTTGSLRAWRVR